MNITLPELSLVVLIGPSGSGKSTFAREHFRPTETLSSDSCRGLVSDDENDQAATRDAFDVLHYIAAKRLAAGRLTVVDATNVQKEARKPLVEIAREYHCLPCAIVFSISEKVCQERNRNRENRDFGTHVIRRQISEMRRNIRDLRREGFRHVFVLESPEQIAEVTITRDKLWNNRKEDHGPFDIIGDVHGCHDELTELLEALGYQKDDDAYVHPEGRRLVFLGDLVDRGPKVVDVLKLVMASVARESALAVPGNHDMKLMRWLNGKNVQITHGLDRSIEELCAESSEFRTEVKEFLDGLVSHYVFDDGKLVAAHAGMKEEMQGRGSGRVRDFALYGETTGETDEFGLPERLDWTADYRGKAAVIYGHTPVYEVEWRNNTINLDTGCVFGGKLTALRYPEREIVSVPSLGVYAEPRKPFLDVDVPLVAPSRPDDLLDIGDVTGKRIVDTRLRHNITIREENAVAALEVMSRFAADPKWLIYLPPTMSPSETSQREGYLEYPSEAFTYFRSQGVPKVICEEKHMGSRAVVIVCKDEEAARKRFRVQSGGGICYTRTGRPFFTDACLETEFLGTVRSAVDRSGLWEELRTDWLCMDCELMPWSMKAHDLIRRQYAAVGAAAGAALPAAVEALKLAMDRGAETSDENNALLNALEGKRENASAFIEAYRRYCWDVRSIADLKLAPFHLLASEGQVHMDKDHVWHMSTLAHLTDNALIVSTPCNTVDLSDPESEAEATGWWESLTNAGGEGMVIKPFQFIEKGPKGLIQPALKCRGREYLRIIYGPDYTMPENLKRLRVRSLGAKRSLAAREFALGVESLERFVRNEPLYRVHECVFGVLAMESEPVDPRL